MADDDGPEELTAPFFMLTYGDLMTLLLTFFILLFTMSTIQVVKFQAQIGAIKGALGIMEYFHYAPMLKTLPTPSVKESPRVIARSSVKPTSLKPLAQYTRDDLTEPIQHEQSETVQNIIAIGANGGMHIIQKDEEVVLVLPSFGVFGKDSSSIDPNSSEVQRVSAMYDSLSKQMSKLTNYDFHFVGHTDSISSKQGSPAELEKMNMELGFDRSVEMYRFFFKKHLTDRSRITFSSQADNVPILPNAKLDSERRKNRRVEIHLRRKR
ncbi:hypothetical protein AB751O23_AK_00090 [Chlamydiales bacterium SCGC AB-751-O23]|jgi:chemotaxis protein MotB|nr:hypothetical protein AB751O23_AK_00090 [Chlamydiales bacterium SCGC AB-751-O23]